MADPVSIGMAVGGIILGKILADMLEPGSDTPIKDEKPTTLSTRGSYLPLLIGRDRLGAFFAWAGNRKNIPESNHSGGKGVSGPSGDTEQDVYYEDGAHFLCIGPARALHRIWMNGEEVFNPDTPVTPQTHPEGSEITVYRDEDGDNVEAGTLRIFWGFPDGDIDEQFAQSDYMGTASAFPYLVRFHWKKVRLGGVPTWPLIEYEIETRPFKSTYIKGTNWNSLDADFDAGSSKTHWLDNFFGPNGDPLPIIRFGNAGPTTKIWFEGDQRAAFQDALDNNERVTIEDSELGSNNGTFRVTDVVWSATANADVLQDWSTLDEGETSYDTLSNASVALSSPGLPGYVGFPEPDGDYPVFVFSQDDLNPGAMIWNFANDFGTYTRFKITLRPWAVDKDFDDFEDALISFEFYGAGGSQKIVYDWTDGSIDTTQADGATLTVQQFGYGWRAFTLFYIAGSGGNGTLDNLNVRLIWDVTRMDGITEVPAKLCVDNTEIEVRNTTTAQSATSVTLDEILFNSSAFDGGTAQPWQPGFGPEGPNPASTLYQLLFAPSPHGAGLDQEDFFIYNAGLPDSGRYSSLESLKFLFATGAETIGTHILIRDGGTFQDAVQNFLLDMGWMISWIPDIGRFGFIPIRDPNNASLVGSAAIPQIQDGMVPDSLPETEVLLEDVGANRISYTYRDYHRNFRNDSIVVDSSGSILDESVQRQENIQLFVARERESAERIASRRSQAEIQKPGSFNLKMNHEAKRLYPGLPFHLLGIEGISSEDIFRILSVGVSPTSSEVDVQAIYDTYSLETGPVTSNLALSNSGFGGNSVAGVNDLALALVELPASLSGTSNTFTVLRIRANQRIENADIHISRSGVTYNFLARQGFYCGGGTLLEEWASSEGNETVGPLFRALGQDTLSIAQTLTTEDFQNGRQVAYIGGEWFFFKSLEVVSSDTFRFKDFHRAKFGSSATTHAIGDVAFIFNPSRAPRYRDVLAVPGQTVIVKVAPKATTRVALASASTAQRTFTGIAGPVTNVIHGGDETDLAATYPAASYPGSTVLLQNSGSSNWESWYSDGSSWNKVQ